MDEPEPFYIPGVRGGSAVLLVCYHMVAYFLSFIIFEQCHVCAYYIAIGIGLKLFALLLPFFDRL